MQSSLTYSEHANNFTDVQKGCTKLTNEWMKTSLACSDTSKLTFVQSELVLIESWWNEESSVHIHVRISVIHSAIQWQKEATLGNYISRKWAKCIRHVHLYIDINAISLYLDLDIFQQDETFCSKLGMELDLAKSNLKTSLSQIWVICQLLPFVRIRQHSCWHLHEVSGEEYGAAGLILEQEVPGGPAGVGVHSRRGLIQDDYLRSTNQGHSTTAEPLTMKKKLKHTCKSLQCKDILMQMLEILLNWQQIWMAEIYKILNVKNRQYFVIKCQNGKQNIHTLDAQICICKVTLMKLQ